MTRFLVRPDDFHIFELEEATGWYRSWSTRHVTTPAGERPSAYKHFNYENLVNNWGFIPIEESQLLVFEFLHKEYLERLRTETFLY